MQTLKTPPGAIDFSFIVPPLSRPLAIEPPSLELQRGELAVVVGERGVEVRIVHRRTVVDDHEVDEAGRGEKRLVNHDLSQAVGPSQVLHGVPRPGRSAESGFNPECQVWEIRDLSKDLIHGTFMSFTVFKNSLFGCSGSGSAVLAVGSGSGFRVYPILDPSPAPKNPNPEIYPDEIFFKGFSVFRGGIA